MSYLTFNGKLVKSNNSLLNYVVPIPPVDSSILLSYLDAPNVGLIKSLDSGVNFVYDTSTYTLGYGITIICHDPSGDVLLCGTNNGWVFTYKNGVFDSSTLIMANGIGDIQIRGNIRVAANIYSGAIVPF
jgi:hypothetical protein